MLDLPFDFNNEDLLVNLYHGCWGAISAIISDLFLTHILNLLDTSNHTKNDLVHHAEKIWAWQTGVKV